MVSHVRAPADNQDTTRKADSVTLQTKAFISSILEDKKFHLQKEVDEFCFVARISRFVFPRNSPRRVSEILTYFSSVACRPCLHNHNKFLHGQHWLIAATIVSIVTKIKMAGENEFNNIYKPFLLRKQYNLFFSETSLTPPSSFF